MLRPLHFVLLASLLADGGPVLPPPAPTRGDAGAEATASSSYATDAGTVARKPTIVNGIRWPDEVQLLATLDGRAVIAAHAAMQHLMARLAKEDTRYAGHCDYSPTAMDVSVGVGGGMYIVRITPRVDRCGWADPSFNAALGWFELYAVSQDGRVLARHPHREE
jgi:hypothetical protein